MQRSMPIRGMLAPLVLSAIVLTTAAAAANVGQLQDATQLQDAQLVAGATATKPTILGDVVVGQLVDSACNMMMARTAAVLAPEHLKCAIVCAQKGGRLAVVTAMGEVYMVTGALTLDNNAKLIQFVNQNVTVTGTVSVIQAALQPADAVVVGTVDAVLQPPTRIIKGEPRRATGSEDGVVVKTTFRKGGFREGDVRASTELSIDAVDIALSKAQ